MTDAWRRSVAAVRLAWWLAMLVALLVWAAFLALYAAHLLLGHSLGNVGCEYPAGSSNYGDASWQWWYPGTRCTYSAAETQFGSVYPHTDKPTWLSGAAAVALAVWPIVWAAAVVTTVV